MTAEGVLGFLRLSGYTQLAVIVELSVENLAIIERADLTLGPGFTVLTGETGAGKSLLIDAVQLAVGDRSDQESVRAGAKSALVSAVFDLSRRPDLLAKCEELGVAVDEGCLYVQREILAEGRSQCRVGGRLTAVSVLKQLGQAMVDLHGQHDHQSLLFPDRHLPFLDHWIGKEADAQLAKVAAAHGEVRDIKGRLESLRTDVRNREQKLDLLHFQIKEIEEANPVAGEMDEAVAHLNRLQNLEKLSAASIAALSVLCDGDTNAIDLIRTAIHNMDSAVKFDDELEGISKLIRDALVEIDEATRSLRAYEDNLEADPATLEELAARIEVLKRLRRKYGEDEFQILEFLASARKSLAEIEDVEEGEERLKTELSVAVGKLGESARELSKLRRGKADKFCVEVENQLQDLALERAHFEVRFEDKDPDESGMDLVEFYFSANPGEPARPLAKTASGGEVSRLMLAIKSVLATGAGVPTLIFDEVDSGLGGRVAFTLGRKLEQLGSNYQVLVISHLPQVAARAQTHYKIEKVEQNGRVVTQVRKLEGDERLEEVARMLGGHEVSAAALANAQELLAEQGVSAALYD